MGDFPSYIKVKPLNGRILIRELENYKTSSGIIIPPSTTTKLMLGKVLDVSPGYYDGMIFREHQIHIGDVVVYSWKAGADVSLEDDRCRLIHEKEILARVEGYD